MRLTSLLIPLCLLLGTQPATADTEPAHFSGMLATHNAARTALGLAALGWSDALASEAQSWADQLARENCQLRYDPNPIRRETTGQNLYRAYGSAPYEGSKRSAEEVAARWLREGSHYDHATHQCKPGLGSQCGAYLQAIWGTTTAMGCGFARCAAAEVWACHYTPRGGQDGLKPYGNLPQASPAPAVAPVQECSWQGPTPADQLSDALQERLQQQP